MVPQVVGFVVPAFHIARTEQDDIGQQTPLNGRFKHLKIGGHQGNMVVESNTITHRSEGVEHPRITQCIAQTVKPVEEENGSFVAPLESVENGIHFLALGQNIVARCLRRKKGVRLRFRSRLVASVWAWGSPNMPSSGMPRSASSTPSCIMG